MKTRNLNGGNKARYHTHSLGEDFFIIIITLKSLKAYSQ